MFLWMKISFKRLLLYSLLLHIILILYGLVQDTYFTVKYTDVDYWVFWEAANNWINKRDPFLQPVYRYTPLLAWILSPFAYLGLKSWGKIVFSLTDLCAGWLIYKLLKLRRVRRAKALVSWLWLFNPLVLTISTRGNAESIVCSLLLGFVYLMSIERRNLAALILGIATHVKLFPVVYGITALISMGILRRREHLTIYAQFFFISAGTFALLTLMTFILYGQRGVHSSLLYHLTRRDVRHNFSPYFYPFYLSDIPSHQKASCLLTALQRLTSFLPQTLSTIVLSYKFGEQDLMFACLLQTIAFVTFNKVCTSQVHSII